MDPNQLLMMLMFFGGEGRGAEVVKRAAPAMLGRAGVAAAVLMARKEFKQQDETHKEMIQDVVDGANVTTIEALAKLFPAVHAVYLKLPPAVQAGIDFSRDRERRAGGSRKSERAAA